MVGVVWPYLYTCPFLLLFQSVSEEGTERVEIFSDEDEDFSSPEEGSDSEPMLDDQVSHTRRLMSGRKARGLGAGKSNAAAARQRNLKQKFVSLLKKFKVTDPEELDQEQANLDQKISGIEKTETPCIHKTSIMIFGTLPIIVQYKASPTVLCC